MAKRDYVAEILDRRQRLRFRAPLAELTVRFMFLELEFMKSDKLSDELMRYFPIAIVACMESFFRLTIADLIDDLPAAAERIDSFDDIRVDLKVLKAVHGRRVTMGDFVSHLLGLNSLSDINKALSKLLAADFKDLVRKRHENPEDDIERGAREYVNLTAGELFEGVDDAFRLRHIFAHEFASTEQIDRTRIRSCFNAAMAFMLAATAVIDDIVSPDAPKTLQESEMRAEEAFRTHEERLAQVIAGAEAKIPETLSEAFADSEASWRVARDKFSSVHAKLTNERFTTERLRYLQAASFLTRRRVEEIELFIDGVHPVAST